MGEVKGYQMNPVALRRVLLASLVLSASLAIPDTIGKTAPGFTFGAFGGKAFPVVGSEVSRHDFGFDLGYGKPEPRFRLGKLPAQLVYEAYYMDMRSEGIDHFPGFTESVFGALAFARYRWPRAHAVGGYGDMGIGLAYADRSNRDLDSRIDSTPYLGAGLAIASGKSEWLIGLSILHISNAGTKGNNQGINNLLFDIRYRF